MAETVVEGFDELGFDVSKFEAKATDRILSLCDMYPVDHESVSTEFLAFMFKKNGGDWNVTPTLENLEAFEKEHLSTLASKNKENAARGVINVSSLLMDGDSGRDHSEEDELSSMYGVKTPVANKSQSVIKRQLTPDHNESGFKKGPGNFATPTRAPDSPSLATPGGGTKYANRINSRQKLLTYGEGPLSESRWATAAAGKETFTAMVKPYGKQNLEKPYRHMFESLREKAGFLDETLCRLGDWLTSMHNLDVPQAIKQTIPDTTVVSGRICCDAADSKLNAHSILLQGSQDVSSGLTVALDVSKIKEYSLFPGQIVAGEAVNPNGLRLVADSLYSDATPGLPSEKDRIKEDALNVIVASGPFTTSDNLDFVPLGDLCQLIRSDQPHLVILTGPFVDAKHPMIEACDADKPFSGYFDDIMGKIKACVENTHVQVILVPSSRDVHHHYIYPTPPFAPSTSDQIHMFPDPCLINVEGIVFGVTSTDVLFHLGKEEICFPPKSGDRLRRLTSHLFQQRSFYPLYPPNEELNVDYEKFESFAQMPIQPHVTILPSDFMHFVKEINGGVAVNPSRLTKGTSGGVFMRMIIEREKDEDQDFAKRVSADILRI